MIDVQGKRVLVVGLARSGRAAARILRRKGAMVTVTDSRPPAIFQAEINELTAMKIGLELGLHREETFLKQDLIVVSPGVPWDMPQLVAARQQKISIVPEIEVASWYLTGSLVGVTGSNGKTTTTSLLGKMLESSGLPTFVGGNIGVPLISAVEQAQSDSVLVAELSSFQLETIQSFHPHVAVLLNLSPNHLDRHHSFEAYVGAKARIFHNQTADDYAILNADDPNVMGLAPAIVSQKIFFSRRENLPDGVFAADGHIIYRLRNLERVLLETSDVRLRGDFNVEDVLAAAAAACVVGADFEALRKAVREFNGVEHRLEYVRSIHRVEFYNDSKATSVDATAKALTAFERGVHLILGGKDKGAPYTPLRHLLKNRVREVLLIGAAADQIATDLQGVVPIVRAGDLESAMRLAFRAAVPGDVVLLAPACASYDQFQDFEHRGRVFKELVARLAEEAAIADSFTEVEIVTPEPVISFPPEPDLVGNFAGTPLGPEATTRAMAGLEQTAPAEGRAEAIPPITRSRPPAPVPRSLNPELVCVYEVAAEEFAPRVDDFVAVSAGDDSELGMDVNLAALEEVSEEALPFEIPGGVAADRVAAGVPGVQTENQTAAQSLEKIGSFGLEKDQQSLFENRKSSEKKPGA